METKKIYKFRAMSVNSLSTIASKKVWFSSQEDLNDPFEGIVNVIEPKFSDEKITKSIEFSTKAVQKQSRLTNDQAKHVVLSHYLSNPEDFLSFVGEGIEKFKGDLHEYQRKLGIFSTASDIPEDSITQVGNMLLWSHYGDQFKGFCIKYDAEVLQSSLIEQNPESTFAWTPVKYVDSPHSIDILGDSELSATRYLKSIQCKHEQWGYECEWRLISTTTGLKSHSADAVTAIYIGERMPKDQVSLLIGVIKHNLPNTEVFRVNTDKNHYALSINKI